VHAGRGEREQSPQPGAGVAALALQPLGYLRGRPLPGVEHLLQQCASVAEVRAIDAAWHRGPEESLRVALDEQLRCLESEDFTEARRTMTEGRVPQWRGR
jgi:hypothetical protein